MLCMISGFKVVSKFTSCLRNFHSSKRKMSVFVQKLNVLTGASEWHVQDEQYDFHQEIARSAFADMLHDTDRNEKYYIALKIAIGEKHETGQKAHVLDIGTGTGLLSMMAAACNADSITACECFPPIASIATEVIEKNGFKDRINVVGKRSTELVIGQDMKRRANILVTEVFDTELIGEGAIETFNHAKKHLLEPDAVVIPSIGWMYAAIIECPLLSNHNRLRKNIFTPKLSIPPEIQNCTGSAALHDLQVSQLPPSSFRLLTKPAQVFSFDFSKGNLKKFRESTEELEVIASGQGDCAIVWWELGMLGDSGPYISCAPTWAPGSREPSWRDHWMQAVYYLPGDPLELRRKSKVKLTSYHDQYSLWFQLDKHLNSDNEKKAVAPVCTCGLHVTSSRSRIAAMSDEELNSKYTSIFSKVIEPSSIVMFLGDTSLLPLRIAQLGAKKVYCVEENKTAYNVVKSLIEHNGLEDKVILLEEYNMSVINDEIDVVISEPFFRAALLPWDQLRCWYLSKIIFSNAKHILPSTGTIYALPMHFDHLHKIRAPLEVVEGFNMAAFDKLIKESSDISDTNVEPHPLWEYPGIALSRPEEVMTFQLDKEIPEKCCANIGSITLTSEGTCNGIALWMEWKFGDTIIGGTSAPVQPGKKVEWDILNKQGVHFFPDRIISVVPGQTKIAYNVTFEPTEAVCAFHFTVS